MTTSLRDGTHLTFRPIRSDDKDRLRAGFEELSPAARYARFLRPLTKLSADQLVYLTEVDMQDHFAWVAIASDAAEDAPGGSGGVGVGRWIRLPGEPDVAEVAITVIDSFQRRGIGHTLLWLCALSASERQVRAFRIWMLGENRNAMSLLRRLAPVEGRWESGVFVATTPLPDPDALRAAPPPLSLTPTVRHGGRASPAVSSQYRSGKPG